MSYGFTFKLQHEDGTEADPPTFTTAAPNWSPGDTIPLGTGRTLRVIEGPKAGEGDEPPVLIVVADAPFKF